jgi:uncharacterized protein involved in exopolysaccharide biosynthesis
MERNPMEQHGMERKGLEYMGRGASPSLQGKVKGYVDIAIRRKWLILSIVMISVGVAGTVAWFKNDVYRSSTVILVEQQTIPEKYVSSVLDDVAGRVSTITQQVLSRTSLVKVIDEFGLYQVVIKEDGYESAILNMRENIQVETKGRSRIEAFTISFAHNDPTTAMKVTSKLASKYIQENLKLREQFVEGASDFLETELRGARNELESKEQALGQFKNKYMGELPSQLEANLSTLDRLQVERVSNQEAINTVTNRLMLVDQAIRDYETTGAVSANAEINVSGGVKPGRPSVDPQMAQLRTLEQDLVRLSAEYTDVYPDVILLKQQIGVLKAELRDRTDMSVEETDSPETIQIFDPYLKRLVKDRGELNFQIATLNNRMNTIGTSMDMLQGRVDRTAAREQELLSLPHSTMKCTRCFPKDFVRRSIV